MPRWLTARRALAANPSGYLNFDSYYNANAGQAAKAANNLNANVTGQVGTASKDLATAQSQFTGVPRRAGTPAGPSGSDFQIATGNRLTTAGAAAGIKGCQPMQAAAPRSPPGAQPAKKASPPSLQANAAKDTQAPVWTCRAATA